MSLQTLLVEHRPAGEGVMYFAPGGPEPGPAPASIRSEGRQQEVALVLVLRQQAVGLGQYCISLKQSPHHPPNTPRVLPPKVLLGDEVLDIPDDGQAKGGGGGGPHTVQQGQLQSGAGQRYFGE